MGGREDVVVRRLGSAMPFPHTRLSRFRLRPTKSPARSKRMTPSSPKKKARFVWCEGVWDGAEMNSNMFYVKDQVLSELILKTTQLEGIIFKKLNKQWPHKHVIHTPAVLVLYVQLTSLPLWDLNKLVNLRHFNAKRLYLFKFFWPALKLIWDSECPAVRQLSKDVWSLRLFHNNSRLWAHIIDLEICAWGLEWDSFWMKIAFIMSVFFTMNASTFPY